MDGERMPNGETGAHTSKMAWAIPGVETVRDGVHRIVLPLPMDALTAVNVYALETSDGLLLIDGGWSIPEGRRQLEASLAQIGFALADISEILVTHIHRDHYTLASALREEIGCRVRLGEHERENLEVLRRDPLGGTEQFDRLRRIGSAHLVETWMSWLEAQSQGECWWESPSDWLEDEVLIERGGLTVRAIPTPGHTRGHYVFLDDARGLLFSGDHILPTITPSIGFEPVPGRLALGAYLDSLRLIQGLGDFALMPSHGPAGMSSRDRAAALLDHHDERLAATLDAVVRGGENAHDVASSLTWTRREHRLDELEPYNRAFAALETEHHLELLEHQGRVRCTIENGVRRYWQRV